MCRKAAWAELTARVTLVEAIRGFGARRKMNTLVTKGE